MPSGSVFMRRLHLGSMKESPSSLAQRILCEPYFPLLISNGIRFPFPSAKTHYPMTPLPLALPVKHRCFFGPRLSRPDVASPHRGTGLWLGRGLLPHSGRCCPQPHGGEIQPHGAVSPAVLSRHKE